MKLLNFFQRNFFLVVGLLFLLAACGSIMEQYNGLKVKIYYSRPDLGGFVRQQENEFVAYEDTKGMLGISQPDFDAVLNLCFGGRGDQQQLDKLKTQAYSELKKFGDNYEFNR